MHPRDLRGDLVVEGLVGVGRVMDLSVPGVFRRPGFNSSMGNSCSYG